MNYRLMIYGAGLGALALLLMGGAYLIHAGGAGGALWHQQVMHRLDVPMPPTEPPLPLPPISGSDDPSLPLVVIDPGHGGRDPGAVNDAVGGRRLMEKDVTLALARAVRDGVVAQGRVRVALTRDDDRYITLPERYELARKMGAGLFLSIHADAAENEDAHGASVYTLSETASDREAARLAARENGGAVINGVPLSSHEGGARGVDTSGGASGDVSAILIDLSQRDAMRSSADFAQILYREAGPYIGFRGRWHRYASLVVLKAPDMPSLLFEAGYISSAQDAARLADQAGRDKIAQGVARAIAVYFARQSDRR